MSRKSILQDEKKCFICGTMLQLERHHVIFGKGRRQIADRLGLTVYLCHEHHQGAFGVHGKHGQKLDGDLKRYAQTEYERRHQPHGRIEWLAKIGRSYL